MRESTTLARRSHTDERAERILASALKGKGGALTRADAIALTGLSASETDTALKSLLRNYKSHLAVTEQGELLYKFDPAMVRRDAVTLGERLAELGRLLWKGFTFLFKIWIVFTLIFYVVAFVAMMLALIFAQSASDREDRRDRGGFGINPWLIYWLMPDWAPAGYYGDPRYGRRALPRKPKKRFYQSVFDYVFGPKGPQTDPLGAEKEVVAYLRAYQGRVTATDLVALTGWSYDRAEEEATRLLASYDGEPEIAEDGTLVYSFPEIRRTAGEVDSAERWQYAWQARRTPAPLTGNTSGANTAITVMNGFNLVASLTIGPAFLPVLATKWGVDPAVGQMVVSYFPLAFSSIFYGVPAGRAIRRSRAMKRLLDEQARAQLVGAILERRGAPTTPEALIEAAIKGGAEPARAKRMLEKVLVDLDGDVVTDEAGTMRYRFPRIAEELAAAEAARALAPATEREAGPVLFSSEEEGSGELPQLPGDGKPSPRRQLH